MAPRSGPRLPPVLTSLSARLLVLTVFFVMLAEFMIYTPSIARFRKVYLEEQVARARLASLALEATPDGMLSKELEDQLLSDTGVYAIILHHPERKVMIMSRDMPSAVDATFDLRRDEFLLWIRHAFSALVQDGDRVLRVFGISPRDPNVVVEVVLDEMPMREAMYGYSGRILNLSIVISLFTAGLVYVSLQWLMVRPMRRVTASMADFRENPEDFSRTIRPSSRRDEIGIAQRELAVMQDELRSALKQKSRLATLGAAVAKINHDLRNSLATAVLVFDHLANVDDPEVKRVLPRLYGAIDRAVTLCSQTLNYVGAELPKLNPDHFSLGDLVDETATALDAPETGEPLAWRNDVPVPFDINADRAQLFRVLSNLAQNAQQAGAGSVTVSARRDGGWVMIDLVDDGPGLPAKATDHLFEPFAGSAREGGTGLGLVIARDILRAHGGDLILAQSGGGAAFQLRLPARRRRPRGSHGRRDA